ncbi:GNAT family N-acetyltransferase [Aquimarina hainanensis]|uniref:GNAT family N-acetyltransferase n=1 Tax=Aquimarina hainanensis TaxID=1578017 RepID=A0ABW5N588_9FLAO|nr:GNAT family N-acetyltransferase [Aquimarina sp. TRL1]QKX04513.1 GNAT family N-acetyltransferase [Aquimarina sp. TRL1]
MSTPLYTYSRTTTEEELYQILQLQKKNLATAISTKEKQKEGYVTVIHDFETLKKMHLSEPHIIAKHNDTVIGYALSMTIDFREKIPVLAPMFTELEKYISQQTSYIIMGQICIDKAYRKQGVFKNLYHTMRSFLKDHYELLITEVATNNIRSLAAHHSVGFSTLSTYSSGGKNWELITWDWK